MDSYQCEICGLIYDEALGLPEHGIPPGTPLNELPADWVCPDCGALKSAFRKEP